jgi:hypothetical protein
MKFLFMLQFFLETKNLLVAYILKLEEGAI